jgi:hypothetical protein
MKIGKTGTEWGAKHRSQIMFWAFWISFISWVMLGAALGCISTSSSVVTDVSFFQGTITITDPVTDLKTDMTYFAGLKRLVVNNCDLGDLCPPHSQPWDSVSCAKYFSGCDSCRDASEGSVTMVIMSFVTQFPQLNGNLGRSKGKAISLILQLCVIADLSLPRFSAKQQQATTYTVRRRKLILLPAGSA